MQEIVDGYLVNDMEDIDPFTSGFPLKELPEVSDEAFFAYHTGIGKLLYLNKAFEEIWEISRTDAMANPSMIKNSVHTDDREYLEKSFANFLKEARQNVEFRITVPGKAEKWINLKVYISGNSNNHIIIGIATDISVRKEYGDTLYKFNIKKNSILTILSHDLLGPLGNIKMALSMLTEFKELKGNSTFEKLLNVMSTSCQNGVTMIHNLINNEFLQSSVVVLVKERVNLVEKIDEAITQFKQSPNNLTHQRFIFKSETTDLYVSIDVSKFMQVLTNLLSNALKFTPDDGTISLYLEDHTTHFLIQLTDTGIGIPAEMQPYLFEKFTPARRTGIKGEPSTGLGMSIIKTIVEWHDGSIWFESEEGKGTTFFIKIPM